MKHGVNPTREQKKLMRRWGLNVENWLVAKNTPEALTVIHRLSEQVRVIPKITEGE